MSKRKKTHSPDAKLVATVKTVLAKQTEIEVNEPIDCRRAVWRGNDVGSVLLLNDHQWAWIDDRNGARSLHGIVGGYNYEAPHIAQALATLGVVSQKAADAFHAWFHGAVADQEADDALERARAIAATHGYELRRKSRKR